MSSTRTPTPPRPAPTAARRYVIDRRTGELRVATGEGSRRLVAVSSRAADRIRRDSVVPPVAHVRTPRPPSDRRADPVSGRRPIHRRGPEPDEVPAAGAMAASAASLGAAGAAAGRGLAGATTAVGHGLAVAAGAVLRFFRRFLQRTAPPRGPRPVSDSTRPPEVNTHRRIVAVFVALVLLFTIVGVRLVFLQVVGSDQYEQFGLAQRMRTQPLAADRGTLFDRNGVELALSVPQKSVFVDPKLVTDPAGEAVKLAAVLGVDAAEIERKMRAPNRFAYVARYLDDAKAKQVADLGLAGVAFVDEPKRFSPSGDLARSIVGGVDTDGVGISGIEKRYEEQLRGNPGKLVLEQSPEGRTIPVGDQQIIPAQKGESLVLTIDRSMQFEVERILGEQVKAVGAKGATAVVSKTDTGEILAMANVTNDHPPGAPAPAAAKPAPADNPPAPESSTPPGVSVNSNNVALTGVYEPGSVMKLVAAAGAVEDGKVSPDTVMNLPVELTLGDAHFTDAEGRGAVSWPVSEIISQSSNIGTIMLGQKLGRERLYQYMSEFGFGKRTAIDFPGEQRGVVPKPQTWWASSAGSIPIGQGVSVTPVQMLAAYNVIANGGTYQSPKLVQSTVDGDGHRRPTPAENQHRVVSQATADKLNVILRGVVSQGTGKKAAVAGYTVAGKTGTARKPQPGGGYTDAFGVTKYQSTFVGFAPAEAPAVSVLVMIDEPAGDQIFGGTVAAPVYSRITEFALHQLGVPPPATDPPAGGGPADSERQAHEAGSDKADGTPAFVTLPDGRVRAVAAGGGPAPADPTALAGAYAAVAAANQAAKKAPTTGSGTPPATGTAATAAAVAPTTTTPSTARRR